MKRILSILFLFLSLTAIGQRVKLLQLERFLGDSVPVGLGRVGYVGLTDTLGDQHYKKLDSIIVSISDSLIDLRPWQYIDSFYIVNDTAHISLWNDNRGTSIISLKAYIDTAMAQGDDQYIDTFYFDMDTLFISLYNDGRPLHKVYLGTLISLADQDKQRFDSCFILADQIILSIQRDSVNAHVLDLTPYKQYYIHTGTTSYTNTLSYGGGAWTLLGSTYIGVSHDGLGNVTLSNNGMGYWQLNGIDDTHGSTMIMHSNTATFDGTGGLTAKLSASGSATMVIDGSLLQWIIAASGGGTSQTIGDFSTPETVTIAGGGINVATISSNTVTITGTEVDGSITNEAQSLAVSGTTTGILTLSQANGAGGGTGTIAAAGINTINVSGTTITITGTELDGDPANELQTIAVTGTTTGIVTLSHGGGSFTIQGAGSNTVSRSGTNIIITGTDTDTDNYVDALTYSTSTYILTVGRTGVLSDLTATVKDDDWWKVGTTLPPNNTEDARRNGLTGIGMDPAWILDVVSDSRIAGHHIGTGPNTDPSNLRLGKDAMQFNAALENLAIGTGALTSNIFVSTNLAVGNYALSALTGNFGYNLAVGHNAMALSTYSYDNTMIGMGAGYGFLTSSYNTGVGHGVLSSNKRGDENTVVGDYSILNDTNSVQNSTLGRYSMEITRKTRGNVSLGYSAMRDIKDSANYNVVAGYYAMEGSVTSTKNEYNIIFGFEAAKEIVGSGDKNILSGYKAGSFINGSRNIGFGDSVLYSTVGDNNYAFGNKITTGTVNDNVIIGSNQHVTTSGNVILTNGLGSTAGLRMLTTGFWGVNEATPTQRWHVNGNLRVTGAVYDSNNDPGTLGQMMSSTVTGWDWIAAPGGGTMSTFSINAFDDSFGAVAVTNGQTIGIMGVSGITAKLASGSSPPTIEISGAGITGSTDLGVNPGGNPSLTSDTGSDVIFQDGSGIDFQYINGFTISAAATDALTTNEGQLSVGAGSGTTSLIQSNTSGSGVITLSAGSNIAITESGNTITIDATAAVTNLTWTDLGTSVLLNSSTGTDLQINESTGLALSASGTVMTISVADQANNNEGPLTVAAGASNTSIINSNTPGSAAVTLLVNSPLTITESGSTITLGSTAVGTVTSISLTTISAELNVTGPSPVTSSGGWTLQVSGDLAAIQNLTSETGIAVRTGTNTWAMQGFTSLATGFSPDGVLYIDASGTPQTIGGMQYNPGSNTLTVTGTIVAGLIQGGSGSSMTSPFIYVTGSYADDAAAGAAGLTSGRVYKTADGNLRVKL